MVTLPPNVNPLAIVTLGTISTPCVSTLPALPACEPNKHVGHGTATIRFFTRREKYVAVNDARSPKLVVNPPSYSLETSGCRLGLPKCGKNKSLNDGARKPSL